MGERKLKKKSTHPSSISSPPPKKSCVCLCKPSPKYGRERMNVCMEEQWALCLVFCVCVCVCVCVCLCLFSLRPQQQGELEASFPSSLGHRNPNWFIITVELTQQANRGEEIATQRWFYYCRDPSSLPSPNRLRLQKAVYTRQKGLFKWKAIMETVSNPNIGRVSLCYIKMFVVQFTELPFY